MKPLHAIAVFLCIILAFTACKKLASVTSTDSFRKVRYVLFTDQDFSNDDKKITFTLFIKKTNGVVLWDTVLAPIKVKNIPDKAHQLIIEKTVPHDDNSTLKIGFDYAIENVGNSWFFDVLNPGEDFKEIVFDVR